MKSILVLMLSLILMLGCKVDNHKNDYLRKVLNNLDQIKSATYFAFNYSYAPGDTSALANYNGYVKEYNNPTDTFIGAAYAHFPLEDTTKMDFFYDGKIKSYLNWTEKTIRIDSFKARPLPFRPVGPPFFNYIRSIIKYTLETKDSIKTDLKDYGDSIQFSLFIYDKTLEFFGKPFVTSVPGRSGIGDISRYDIWINKSNDLPYRYRREMAHNISTETPKSVILNKSKAEDFIASKYFPSDFTIEPYYGKQKVVKNDLVGKVAPDWILKDVNNKTIALKELNSKVLLIEFTSVICGPCLASIPFLKQLVTEYNVKDFDFVSIEGFISSNTALKRYQDRNEITYKFLMSTKEITKSYQIQSIPVFLILDKNRVIRKIIRGYGKGSTDKEIRDAINKLI